MPMLVIPMRIKIAENRYAFKVFGALFPFLWSHIAAMIFPTSRAIPIAMTASIDPGKIVASPIMLKYAAIIEMLNAETKVDIAKIMGFYGLSLAAVFYLRGLLLICLAGSNWDNALRCHLGNSFGHLLLSLL